MQETLEKLKQEIETLNNNVPPQIVFIGGIPGAGKELLIKKAKLDFGRKDFSVIEADLYRKYFKKINDIDDTIKATNNMELELLLYSIAKRKNIIHISTLRACDYIDNLITEKIIPANYEIHLYILITNKIESILSTYERYIYDKQNKNTFPRLNKYEYTIIANEGFEKGLNYFIYRPYFKSINCFIRGNNYSLPVEIKTINGNVISTIKNEERSQLLKLNQEELSKRIDDIISNLETKEELEEFNKIIELFIKPTFNKYNKLKIRR